MKKSTRTKLNLFFSAFLMIGYIVCTYFFMSLASKLQEPLSTIITIVVLLLFGLLVFYATRVGDGKPVKRFSLIVLLLLDLPCLYGILAYSIENLPLHTELTTIPVVFMLACVALGYGLPFTFLSGFELVEEKEDTVLEGGLQEELNVVEEETEETDETEEIEETVVEKVEDTEEDIKEEAEEKVEEKAEVDEDNLNDRLNDILGE